MTDWNVAAVDANWLRMHSDVTGRRRPVSGAKVSGRDAEPGLVTPGIGEVIKARRQELGLTQEELADRVCALGSSLRQSDVSRMEHGKVILPRYKRMTCLAAALELPLGALLDHAGWDGAAALPWAGTAGDAGDADGDSATAERVAVTTTPSPGAADRDPDDVIAWARASVDEARALLRQYRGGSA